MSFICENNKVFEKGRMQTNNPVVNHTKFDDGEFKTSSCTRRITHQCVTVAIRPDVVAVRHTRDPEKMTLEYTHGEWDAFLDGVKKGEFDLKP